MHCLLILERYVIHSLMGRRKGLQTREYNGKHAIKYQFLSQEIKSTPTSMIHKISRRRGCTVYKL